MVLSERDCENVRFVSIEDIVHVFDKLVNIFQGLKRGNKLQPAHLKYEGCHGRGWNHHQIERGFSRVREIIDEDQEQECAQNSHGHSSHDKERR